MKAELSTELLMGADSSNKAEPGCVLLICVDFWSRNCVRRAIRRGGNHAAIAVEKRGFHALPAPEIYTSEYLHRYPSLAIGKRSLSFHSLSTWQFPRECIKKKPPRKSTSGVGAEYSRCSAIFVRHVPGRMNYVYSTKIASISPVALFHA